MNILVKRTLLANSFTRGELYIDGVKYCDTIEDKSRGLRKSDSLESIKARKVKGVTAIPTGEYNIYMTFSPKFKREMPLISSVPGYDGVRIHAGNTAEDTEGCILVGVYTKGAIIRSRDTFEPLRDKIIAAKAHGEEVTIYISE